MRKLTALAVTLFAFIALLGCATTKLGHSPAIAVKAPPAPAAACAEGHVVAHIEVRPL